MPQPVKSRPKQTSATAFSENKKGMPVMGVKSVHKAEHFPFASVKMMEAFNNDLVIRYLDRVIVNDDGYEVVFKAGVKVEIEV